MSRNEASDGVGECSLLGGKFELLVQAFLAVAAVSTLAYKRHRERPPHRRSWLVWALDCSKQAYASALQHGTNIFLGVAFASTGEASECAWYLTGFAVTVVCGVAILAAAMSAYGRCVERFGCTLLRSGEYGTPPSWKPWLAQSLLWGLMATGEKILTAVAVIKPLQNRLDRFAAYMESPLSDHPRLELVLVMVIGPALLNALFFWIMDSIIMRRRRADDMHEAIGPADVSGVNTVPADVSSSGGLKQQTPAWVRGDHFELLIDNET